MEKLRIKSTYEKQKLLSISNLDWNKHGVRIDAVLWAINN